jgi:hypothetical protein
MPTSSFSQPAPPPQKCFMFPPMNIRPLAHRALTSSPIVLLAILAFGGGTAAASNSIEGVWSFDEGAVEIAPLSNGTFQGTVVKETKFVDCSHPVEQVMWTDMQLQPEGYFSGLHQWYHGANCEENPTLGHTAWRVLTGAHGEHTLKVCFNSPGDEVLPTIAASGAPFNSSEYAAYHVTYSCVESKPLAPPQTVEGEGASKSGSEGIKSGSGVITFSSAVVLPSPTACVSQTSLKIALKDPKYDPLSEVVVKLNGKKVADVKGVKKLKKGITLKKLPTGTYKISVVATTVLKQQLTGSQTYKSCTKGSGKIKLKGSKKHP